MDIISSKFKLDSLKIREIPQEAKSFGYTIKTVVKLHSTLIEILMDLIARSGGEPVFQVLLKFTANKNIFTYLSNP